ncbi:hypothetical protein ACP4OV_012599 [Aristida adscensionis]
MSASGSFSPATSAGHSRIRPKGNPQLPLVPCDICGSLVVEKVSHTAANPGRRFYRCVKGHEVGSQCSFFKWQDEYAVWLVDQGYLWCPGEEMAVVKKTVEDLKVSNSRMSTTLKEMHDNLQEQQRAARDSLQGISNLIDQKLTVKYVIWAVLLIAVGVGIMKN